MALMKEAQPKEVKLEEYCPPDYRTETTDLLFDIRDGATRVTATLDVIKQSADGNTLVLDGQELELVSIALDGRELSGNEYSVDEDTLTIHGLSERHTIEIVTVIHPEENTALEGLYYSSNMYSTQCEAQGFRKITYYQDRPDVLAKFTTTIVADAERYPTLLANGNLLESKTVADGRRAVKWEDPFPKPSYLFALVAGDLAHIEDVYVTASGRQVTLQIFSEPHNIEQCHYSMDVLKRSMRWDEEAFGCEYDLDIYMIVAVESFNMGAMENKGLNIFNTSCVLASPDTATDSAYLRVEAVVAHEYFHNWSGNRVTCRDWFQLSLKEGFTVFRDARFTGDMNSHAVKRIEDVSFLRSVQFAEDAGPLAHPVRPPSYIEISNFYTTTIYEKGAEVVRMYHTLLGADKFRQGTDLYFERHDGSAATTDDFAAAMEEAGAIDLTQFKRWYDQAGTPVLEVSEAFTDGMLTLTIEQSCPATPNQADKLPFFMPVLLGLIDPSGTEIALQGANLSSSEQFEMRDGSLLLLQRSPVAQVEIKDLAERPVVSFLRGFSAPVRVKFAQSASDRAHLIRHDSDGFVRWDALQARWLECFEPGARVDEAVTGIVADLARQVLVDPRDAEHKLLMAEMLKVPDANYLFEQISPLTVDHVLQVRDGLLKTLGQTYAEVWSRVYETFKSEAPYRPDADGMANRALTNLALGYYAESLEGQALTDFVSAHYHRADNLTDRRAALAVACNHERFDVDARTTLLQDFYQAWRSEALVVDLWFGLQASSPMFDVAHIERLAQHEDFDLKVPNRVRALVASFGMHNHKRFHALDGSGYRYLAGMIATLDQSNPQIAARIATPLTRWQRYDERRQGLMRGALQGLIDNERISKDLYEIVTKSLA